MFSGQPSVRPSFVSTISWPRKFEALGFSNVETFIASGNVIFEATSGDSAALQRKIEAHLAKSLGHEVSTFVRTDAEVAAIACYRPFTEKKLESALAFNVAFLAEPMDAATSRSVLNFNTDSGKTVAIRHKAIEVLRCQPDGTSHSLARHGLFSL